jgi:hypothetical protein
VEDDIPSFRRSVLAALMPLDAGLLQFTAALRTSLATVASALLIVPLLLHFGLPLIEASPAILFVMLCMLFTRDATLAKRQGTVVMAFIAGIALFVIASALAHWRLLDVAGLLVLLAVATLLQTRGPRVVAIGLAALIGYYLGVFLHPPLPNQGVIVALTIPALAICLAVLRLFPDNPSDVAQLMLASIAAQADRVIREARQAKPNPHRIERHLLQLNRAVMAAQSQLALGNLEGHDSAIAALTALEIAVTHAVLQTEDDARWRSALAALAHAAATLQRQQSTVTAVEVHPAAPAPLAWRPALRAGCAAVMAAVVGYPLSPEHWYWAIISVFVISLGTTSVGDTLQKGTLRIIGTACGALAGLCVAAFVPAHPALVLVGMTICLIGWSYYVLYNYAVGIFFLTLLIGLVYGVLGDDLPSIVGLRLVETAIGAAATFITALWIVPLPTSHHVRARALTLMARLLDVIDTSRDALCGKTATPLLAMRRADLAMQELRVALLPMLAARQVSLIPRTDALPDLVACVHWVRVLAVSAAAHPQLDPAERDLLQDRLIRLRDHVSAFGNSDAALPAAEASAANIAHSAPGRLIADAADRIEAVLRKLIARLGATPREFTASLIR